MHLCNKANVWNTLQEYRLKSRILERGTLLIRKEWIPKWNNMKHSAIELKLISIIIGIWKVKGHQKLCFLLCKVKDKHQEIHVMDLMKQDSLLLTTSQEYIPLIKGTINVNYHYRLAVDVEFKKYSPRSSLFNDKRYTSHLDY